MIANSVVASVTLTENLRRLILILSVDVRIDSLRKMANVFSSKSANLTVRIQSASVQISNVYQDTASTQDVKYVISLSKPHMMVFVIVHMEPMSTMILL
jgi:hypothetical protein